MEKIAASSFDNKEGRWVDVDGFFVYVNDKGQILAPSDLKGQEPDEIDVSQLQNRPVDPEESQLVTALLAANSVQYSRLNEYLKGLAHAVAMGNEPLLEKVQFDKLKGFIKSYTPIDSNMRDFLKKYDKITATQMDALGQIIEQRATEAGAKAAKTPSIVLKNENKINIRKSGLYRFPFLQKEKLYMGEVNEFKSIPQDWNFTGTHFKLWKNVHGLPFLINGYNDDEYSAVNRVLASQAGKILGLQCEEVFFGYFHGKCVTLAAFHEAVTLLENQAFELYPLASNYNYLATQKRAFYFLIQNWVAYAQVDSATTKERFDYHFVDSDGEVFLSKHEQAMFLTPQLMPRNLMVKLDITRDNYQPIKDMVRRVGNKDFADIVFSSIPDEFVDLHDELANNLNKTTFQRKKECFDGNWMNLLASLEEFEQMLSKPLQGVR
jgi:hypothetical protein